MTSRLSHLPWVWARAKDRWGHAEIYEVSPEEVKPRAGSDVVDCQEVIRCRIPRITHVYP